MYFMGLFICWFPIFPPNAHSKWWGSFVCFVYCYPHWSRILPVKLVHVLNKYLFDEWVGAKQVEMYYNVLIAVNLNAMPRYLPK
jgi:hypothetical protein